MTYWAPLTSWARRFQSREDGTTLVELAIVLPLFLLMFFGLIDFGRMAFQYVTAEKAMQLAARVAAVRPAACAGVPLTHSRATVPTATVPARFGTSCSAGGAICLNVGTITCTGNSANPTAVEIWTLVSPVLPPRATIENLRFSYAYDSKLGFLGGPYVPMLTLELSGMTFQFGTPISGLAAMVSTSPNQLSTNAIAFPSMSVSLPAEDLAQGDAG